MTKKIIKDPTSPKYGEAKAKLIEATLDCLMNDGAEGCSIRKICERANVSIGLVNYHFNSIHELIAATYSQLAFAFLNNAIEKCAHYEADPRRQLSVYLESIFSEEVMLRRTLRAWIVFWGMIDSSEMVRRVHDETNRSSWTFLEGMFLRLDQTIQVKLSPRLAAIGLSSMVDGLWLEKCLQPETFTANEAVRLCEFWINSVTLQTTN
ncbi:MAG: TetR/AcrR family bet gene transcriptional repressor [Urechidicola sp.]|jgi:AcrR family transcriptional regulator